MENKFKNYIEFIDKNINEIKLELLKEKIEYENFVVSLLTPYDFENIDDDFKLPESIVIPNDKIKFKQMLDYISTEEEILQFGFYKSDNIYFIPNNYLELLPEELEVYGIIDDTPMNFKKEDYIVKNIYNPLPFGIKLK